MLDNVAVAELTTASRKATSLANPFAVEGLDKDTFYGSLPPKKAGQLKDLELDTVQSVANDIKLKIKIGRNLIQAKKLLKHGEFVNWLKICFAWSEDTANNQMQLARAFENNPNIAKFKPTVAYQLAQKSCPDLVVEQAIALLESGNEVTVNTVKELKQAAKIEAIEPAKLEPEIKPEKPAKTGINKGDIVEWQFQTKGWNFGRVKSKSTDGITCKIESLTGEYLGEKPTKFLSLCPVQKVNKDAISKDEINHLQPDTKVVVLPYTTELKPFDGMVGIVIARYPEKGLISVKIDNTFREFHSIELELLEERPDQIIDIVEDVIDVDSTVVEEPVNEEPVSLDPCKNQLELIPVCKLFMADFEANVRKLLHHVNGDQFDYLLEMVLKHKDDLKELNARYKWDE